LVPDDDDELWRLENDVIEILADLLPIFRREPSPGDAASADEYLQSYLRSVNTGGEELPKTFLSMLQRALRHYGVDSLDRTPELDAGLVFLHKSRARLDRGIDQVFGLLERRLGKASRLRDRARTAFHGILDRLIDESFGRYPALNDLAREVRYALYDRPQFEAANAKLYAEVERRFAALHETKPAAAPEARAEELCLLVDCPRPMISFLAQTFADGGSPRRLAVEVMLRRYYRIRDFGAIDVSEVEGYHVAKTTFEHQGRRAHVVATACPLDDLATALRAINPLAESYPSDERVAIDVYCCNDDIDDLPGLAKQVARALTTARPGDPVDRICVALVKPGNLRTLRYFTFNRTEMGFVEQTFLRGLHPMLAERLELWRLENFETTQLLVSDDIYLFHCVARDNPKDERLFAIVEVRNMTAVNDDEGNVIEMPSLEHLYLEALSNIRD
ncbi:MAG: hypothetical protein KAI47_27210, partial [Deltaproteobacteria bacterium]|nr:hypothetical protein [Deltaproteobacteria bacterium]